MAGSRLTFAAELYLAWRASQEPRRRTVTDAFVEHYARLLSWEAEPFRRAVTDWERRRYFEQV
jgi:glutamine synthetase